MEHKNPLTIENEYQTHIATTPTEKYSCYCALMKKRKRKRKIYILLDTKEENKPINEVKE